MSLFHLVSKEALNELSQSLPEFASELPASCGSYTDGICKNHWLQKTLLLDVVVTFCLSTPPPVGGGGGWFWFFS